MAVGKNSLEGFIKYSGFSEDQLKALKEKDPKLFGQLLFQYLEDNRKQRTANMNKVTLAIIATAALLVGAGVIGAGAGAAGAGAGENLNINDMANIKDEAKDLLNDAAGAAIDKAKKGIWENIAGSFSFGKDTDKSRIPLIIAIAFGLLIAFRTLIFSTRRKKR